MATNVPTQVIITDTFSQQVDKINTISLDLGATNRLLTNQDSDTISELTNMIVLFVVLILVSLLVF